MVLFYDHLLTLSDEIQFIWPAPATYAKYIFLINRYAVLGTLLAVAYGMRSHCLCEDDVLTGFGLVETCGFVDTTFTDTVRITFNIQGPSLIFLLQG